MKSLQTGTTGQNIYIVLHKRNWYETFWPKCTTLNNYAVCNMHTVIIPFLADTFHIWTLTQRVLFSSMEGGGQVLKFSVCTSSQGQGTVHILTNEPYLPIRMQYNVQANKESNLWKKYKSLFCYKWKIEIVSLVGISKSTMSPTFYIHMCMPLSLFSKQFQL